MKFKPAPWQAPEDAAPAVPTAGRAILPEAPRKKNELAERRKPVVVVPVPRPTEPPPPSEPAVAPEVAPAPPAKLPKEHRVMARAIGEKERVFIAAGLVSHQGVARLGQGSEVVFRCPVCSEQVHCEAEDCGREFTCPSCSALLHLPLPEGGGKVRVVSLPKQKVETPGLPPLELPQERSSEGRSHDAQFQAVEELLPEGEEGTLEWGLEKSGDMPEKVRRSRVWVWVGIPLLLLAGGFVFRQTLTSAARASAGSAMPKTESLRAPSGAIDWDHLPATRKYLLVEQTLRSYLEAPDIASKARFTRGGPAAETKMTAYYNRSGGYEPETRIHGRIKDIVLREEREIGGKRFQLATVRFEESGGGIYALERAGEGYLVDWEYAVGYGEVAFAAMVENPPAVPVVLRVYLNESLFFSDGFDEGSFRVFEMSDPSRERTLPVFARRNSPVEEALREAWNNAVLDNIGRHGGAGSAQLDFVLRVRHENEASRRGFVIDEVLVRGWIVPEETK